MNRRSGWAIKRFRFVARKASVPPASPPLIDKAFDSNIRSQPWRMTSPGGVSACRARITSTARAGSAATARSRATMSLSVPPEHKASAGEPAAKAIPLNSMPNRAIAIHMRRASTILPGYRLKLTDFLRIIAGKAEARVRPSLAKALPYVAAPNLHPLQQPIVSFPTRPVVWGFYGYRMHCLSRRKGNASGLARQQR
jgi:hypothetical protein